jgi:hypothetical protein
MESMNLKTRDPKDLNEISRNEAVGCREWAGRERAIAEEYKRRIESPLYYAFQEADTAHMHRYLFREESCLAMAEGFDQGVVLFDQTNPISCEWKAANPVDFLAFDGKKRVRYGKLNIPDTATPGTGPTHLDSILTNAEDRGVPATAANTRGLDTAPRWSGGYTPGTSSNATDAQSNEVNRLLSKEERVAKALAEIKQRLKYVGKAMDDKPRKSGRAESDLEGDSFMFQGGGYRGKAALAK